jgi:hypothetical protein
VNAGRRGSEEQAQGDSGPTSAHVAHALQPCAGQDGDRFSGGVDRLHEHVAVCEELQRQSHVMKFIMELDAHACWHHLRHALNKRLRIRGEISMDDDGNVHAVLARQLGSKLRL